MPYVGTCMIPIGGVANDFLRKQVVPKGLEFEYKGMRVLFGKFFLNEHPASIKKQNTLKTHVLKKKIERRLQVILTTIGSPPMCSVKESNMHAVPITITNSQEIQFATRFLPMLYHLKVAIATQDSLKWETHKKQTR